MRSKNWLEAHLNYSRFKLYIFVHRNISYSKFELESVKLLYSLGRKLFVQDGSSFASN